MEIKNCDFWGKGMNKIAQFVGSEIVPFIDEEMPSAFIPKRDRYLQYFMNLNDSASQL